MPKYLPSRPSFFLPVSAAFCPLYLYLWPFPPLIFGSASSPVCQNVEHTEITQIVDVLYFFLKTPDENECTWQSMTSAKLHVTVVSAKDLRAADRGGKSDPYICVTVGPGGHETPYYTHKTRTIKKTLSPEFNESFDYMLDPKQRRGVLSIEVFDEDKYSTDESLGKVEIPMHTIQPLEQYDVWHALVADDDEHA